MKTEVKSPVLICVLVVVIGGLIAFAYRYINGVGSLDHGQIAYTPGVPPWEEKDPAKKAQFAQMPGELRTYNPAMAAAQGQVRAAHGPQGPKTGN